MPSQTKIFLRHISKLTKANIILNLQSIYKNAHNEDSANNLTSLIPGEYLQELEENRPRKRQQTVPEKKKLLQTN